MDSTFESIGPYVLTRRLGQGGMGSLYVGHLEEDELRTDLAIKVVDEAYSNNPAYVQAFRRESETAASIDHPNIVQVLDRGEDAGRQFLVMELLHGRSLAELFMRCRADDLWIQQDLALWIMARVAEGLHHVHDSRDGDGSLLDMIHGDVSPQNIFLTIDGAVKLIDFGLAHSALRTTDDTSPARMYGKVHYLAPEQAQGGSLDQRADIFGTGATLYELLTAHSAFSAASKYLVLLRISQGDPDPITRHLPDIDSELETIVEKSMAYKPESRYQSADALRAALDNVLAYRGVTPTHRDLAKFIREVFGDAADAASLSPAARRRSTQPLSRRESVSRPEDVQGSSHPWRYLMIGIGVGVIAGVVWVLKLIGAL